MTAVNHHPVYKDIRLCGGDTGTALRFNAITCHACRAILTIKAAKHEATALTCKGAEARFLKADAARVNAMLAHGAAQ